MTRTRAIRISVIVLGLAVAATVTAIGVGFGPGRSATPARTLGRTTLVPAPAPSHWRQLMLPDGAAVLYFPPSMHRVSGDSDAVSAAKVGPDGQYQLYLNATPRQGGESLRNWSSYRLRVLRSDDAERASPDASSENQRFRGGTGSCVIDNYVTRIDAHRYTELACLVQGRTGASVIVATAPAAIWPSARSVLTQAVSAYTVG